MTLTVTKELKYLSYSDEGVATYIDYINQMDLQNVFLVVTLNNDSTKLFYIPVLMGSTDGVTVNQDAIDRTIQSEVDRYNAQSDIDSANETILNNLTN